MLVEQVWDGPAVTVLLKPKVRVNQLLHVWVGHGVLWVHAGQLSPCACHLCGADGLAVGDPVVSAKEVPKRNLAGIQDVGEGLLLGRVGLMPAHHCGGLTGGSGGLLGHGCVAR